MTVNVADVTSNLQAAYLCEISQLLVDLEIYWPWPLIPSKTSTKENNILKKTKLSLYSTNSLNNQNNIELGHLSVIIYTAPLEDVEQTTWWNDFPRLAEPQINLFAEAAQTRSSNIQKKQTFLEPKNSPINIFQNLPVTREFTSKPTKMSRLSSIHPKKTIIQSAFGQFVREPSRRIVEQPSSFSSNLISVNSTQLSTEEEENALQNIEKAIKYELKKNRDFLSSLENRSFNFSNEVPVSSQNNDLRKIIEGIDSLQRQINELKSNNSPTIFERLFGRNQIDNGNKTVKKTHPL
jgi:hypothetical protein